MTPFQSLITGSVAGALMKASADGPLLIDVDIGIDGNGDYTNEILVTGQESKEQLRIIVTPAYDTPESVAEKVKQARISLQVLQNALRGQEP